MARISVSVTLDTAKALVLQSVKEQRSISQMAALLLQRQLVAEGHALAEQPQASDQPQPQGNARIRLPSVAASP